MAVELIYETHSTTTDNEAGIATGWLPGELSAAGREQARQLGDRPRLVEIFCDADFAALSDGCLSLTDANERFDRMIA